MKPKQSPVIIYLHLVSIVFSIFLIGSTVIIRRIIWIGYRLYLALFKPYFIVTFSTFILQKVNKTLNIFCHINERIYFQCWKETNYHCQHRWSIEYEMVFMVELDFFLLDSIGYLFCFLLLLNNIVTKSVFDKQNMARNHLTTANE